MSALLRIQLPFLFMHGCNEVGGGNENYSKELQLTISAVLAISVTSVDSPSPFHSNSFDE